MAAIKHSKQRDAIKAFLQDRYDHPTADTVYVNIRKEFPNISLGTVYRNLSLLADLGDIRKISTGQGPDRFDGNTAPHYHFICNKCGCVSDLSFKQDHQVELLASNGFDGMIESHITYFYGVCADCLAKEKECR